MAGSGRPTPPRPSDATSSTRATPAAVAWVHELLGGRGDEPAWGYEPAAVQTALAASIVAVLALWAFASQALGDVRMGWVAALWFGVSRKFAALGADALSDSLMLAFQFASMALVLAAARRQREGFTAGLAVGAGACAGAAYSGRPATWKMAQFNGTSTTR